MTKKRFIKLVMSHGIQRNKAQKIAARYNSRNIPYKEAYSDFMYKHGFALGCMAIKRSFAKAGEAIKTAACSIKQLAEAIKKTEQQESGAE